MARKKTKKSRGVTILEVPSYERQLVGCAIHLLGPMAEKVRDVWHELPEGAFMSDGAAELAAMIADELQADIPSPGGVGSRLQSSAQAAGVLLDDYAPALFARSAATEIAGAAGSEVMLSDWLLKSAIEVAKAAQRRIDFDDLARKAAENGLTLVGPERKPNAGPNLIPALRDGRKQVMLEPGRQGDTISTCVELVAKQFFVFDGALAAIDRGGAGTASAADLTIVKVTKERLANYLDDQAVFVERRINEDNNPVNTSVNIPQWIPQRLWGMQLWPGVRPLAGIARGPFLRPDGTIGGTTKGHDGPTGLWVETDGEWAGIVMEPTQADAEAARDTLMDLLREFRFSDADVAKSVWLSAVLTVIGRQAFTGPAPVFCIDAPTPGSGKGLLSRLVALIATGREPAMSGLPAKNSEMEKVLTSFHAARAPLALFDNVTTPVGGAALDRQATATDWSDRLLGGNRIGEWPNQLTILVNGNNLVIASDMARRVLHVRLSPEVERPEELTFERGDLAGYVLANRRRLVAAALTILRCQVIAGDAGPRPAPMASFEGWSVLVQRAVVGCGLPDPLASREAVRGKDEGTSARREFIEALAVWDAGFENSARWLWERLHRKDGAGDFVETDDASERLRTAMDELIGLMGGQRKSEAQSLSKVFTSLDGRLFGTLRLTRGSGRNMTGALWRLEGAKPIDGNAAMTVAADDLDDCPMARRSGF